MKRGTVIPMNVKLDRESMIYKVLRECFYKDDYYYDKLGAGMPSIVESLITKGSVITVDTVDADVNHFSLAGNFIKAFPYDNGVGIHLLTLDRQALYNSKICEEIKENRLLKLKERKEELEGRLVKIKEDIKLLEDN